MSEIKKLGPITAYAIAVEHGFKGTEKEWLDTLSAYGIAVANGFSGTEQEWLESLKPSDLELYNKIQSYFEDNPYLPIENGTVTVQKLGNDVKDVLARKVDRSEIDTIYADDVLSISSTRPVQNRVIKAKIDDLTRTDAELVQNISEIETQMTSPFNFKGTVADQTELNAISNPAQNDTYYVIADKCRYSWTGSEWKQSSMDEGDYEDELGSLKTALETALETDYASLTDAAVYDWSVIGNDTYPYGWAAGYYSQDAGAFSSSNYYIRTLATDIHLEENVILFEVEAPSGYAVAVAEYDDTGTFVVTHGNQNAMQSDATPSVTVLHTPGHGYRFSLGRFGDASASDHLTEAFTASIVLTYYKPKDADKIKEMDAQVDTLTGLVVETSAVDWDAFVVNGSPLGWRTGYYQIDDGEYAQSNRYICTPRGKMLTPGVAVVNCTAPEGYAIQVSEYDNHGAFVAQHGNANTTSEDATPYLSLITVEGHQYRFVVGRFAGNDADNYLNASFISQISVLLTKNVTSGEKYLPRTGEMEFFTVTTNVSVSTDGDSTDNHEGDTPQTVNAVISLPSSYAPDGAPVPVIMLCHGQSARVNLTDGTWFGNSADFLRLLRGFTGAGYAVFDVGSTNPSDPDIAFADWGNPALMGAYVKAWEYVKRTYNLEHRLYIYSESMGTQAALNIQQWYPSSVVAACNSAPKVNIAHRLTSTTLIGGYAIGQAVKMRFGFTGNTFPADLIGYDHYAQIKEIGAEKYVFHQSSPIKVLAGTADDPDGELIESREFYMALRNAGNVVYYREIDGASHHDVCYLLPGDTLQEVIDWFNRFRY